MTATFSGTLAGDSWRERMETSNPASTSALTTTGPRLPVPFDVCQPDFINEKMHASILHLKGARTTYSNDDDFLDGRHDGGVIRLEGMNEDNVFCVEWELLMVNQLRESEAAGEKREPWSWEVISIYESTSIQLRSPSLDALRSRKTFDRAW